MDRVIQKKRFTPRRIAWLAGGGLLLLLVIYGLLSASGGSTLKIEASKITISEVTRGEFQEFIPVTGTVMPIKTFYLDATTGGKVVEVFLEEGSYVSAGDRIMRLDNTDLHLDIMYREAQLFEQINNLRNTRLAMEQNSLQLRADLLEIDYQFATSEREFRKCEKLREKNLISVDEFQQAKDTYDYWAGKKDLTLETQRQDSILRTIQIEQLEKSVERMQANLEVVKQKLENLVLEAPITGQLTALNGEVGESKSPGERLGQIDVLDGFKVQAGVDEYYIARVAAGQTGTVAIAGETYELTIRRVYPEVRDGRFQIDLEFEGEEPEGIRRGQSVRIRLMLGDLSEALTVARGGFYNSTGGNWVYVLDKSGEFATKRTIQIGSKNTQVFEVLEGLREGEQVITSSYDNFGDYDKLVFTDR